MRLTPLLATVAVTGALAGGGAAIASAATSTTSTTHTTSTNSTTTQAPSYRAPGSQSQQPRGSHHCPNM